MPFTCAVCGQRHDNLLMDLAFARPDVVAKMSEDERKERVRSSSDLCVLDESTRKSRHFVRCTLFVPVLETGDDFAWGMWAEVSGQDFDLVLATWEDVEPAETAIAATIANAIPWMQDTLGLPVELYTQGARSRPRLVVKSESHSLGVQQQSGLTVHDVAEMTKKLRK